MPQYPKPWKLWIRGGFRHDYSCDAEKGEESPFVLCTAAKTSCFSRVRFILALYLCSVFRLS